MVVNELDYKDTHRYSRLILDYLDKNPKLNKFYNYFPELSNFSSQIQEKSKSLDSSEFDRSILSYTLIKQYGGENQSDATSNNIKLLSKKNTFTVTTGHQLNLFTGPLYFFYKIISVINLCKSLKNQFPEYDFVPIYWMASEDHDFNEINFFNFQLKKISWDKSVSGPVGQLPLQGLDKIFTVLDSLLPNSKNAKDLKRIFKLAYDEKRNLAQATRVLVNSFFSKDGLVIIDGDDPDLKAQFISNIKDEVLNQSSFKCISETNSELLKVSNGAYKIQVNPREINLFYIRDGIRERLVHHDQKFIVLNSDYSWQKEELLKEIDSFPERFSPNAVLRPLYQEKILPNLAYVGGGGELAYWLQLKSCFSHHKITFPMLMMRNSVLIISSKQSAKIEKLDLNFSDFFQDSISFSKTVIQRHSNEELSLENQKQFLKKQFKDLFRLARKTDPSFENAVAAQEQKQIKGLINLEKRLFKAEKRKLKNVLSRADLLRLDLFPNNNFQERVQNFSEFYLEYGPNFFKVLKQNLDPLNSKFTVIIF